MYFQCSSRSKQEHLHYPHVYVLGLKSNSQRGAPGLHGVSHSYLPCDREFGHIEKACKKKQKIQCPDHYVKIMNKITVTQVTKITLADFLDIKSLKKRITERKPKNPNYKFS